MKNKNLTSKIKDIKSELRFIMYHLTTHDCKTALPLTSGLIKQIDQLLMELEDVK